METTYCVLRLNRWKSGQAISFVGLNMPLEEAKTLAEKIANEPSSEEIYAFVLEESKIGGLALEF